MDPLTFIAELTKAAAWPVAMIVLAVMFRAELRRLLSRIKKGKVGSAEFEFESEVEKLAEEIAAMAPESEGITLAPATVQFARTSPRDALLDAWIEIETALRSLAERHELLTIQTRHNSTALIRALAKAELLPRAYVPGFMALRRLRNTAAHELDFTPSEEALLGYLEIAEELKQVVLGALSAR
jgi:thymidylate kinase